ncbi:unnamed protein product [Medioppia subpectinata]|uniref:ABC transporter substrate-binding protein n=1 Tax=Medioppia subpectinata TaxID=1979941 RepID=A0A7R9Q2A9_9ACAR|nr:unnamed protein product [Medioppia subpectinata]CAG2109298.1 unnamed protein product [Medioppia subpectinata]
MDNISDTIRLRAATYLAPNIPVQYFETRLGYIDTSLRYESNTQNVTQVFADNEIDIAWISGTSYIQVAQQAVAALLPVSSVHTHPSAEDCAGYYCDVIIHQSLGSRVTRFADLRGCRWVYNQNQSLTGHYITVKELRQLGEDSTFFGERHESGSDLQSIHMLLSRQSDAAIVDSNCLHIFLDRNPQLKDEIQVLTSFGPMPPYPVVVNHKIPVELRQQIVDALLDMHLDSYYSQMLSKFRVKGFVRITGQEFAAESELISKTNDMDIK